MKNLVLANSRFWLSQLQHASLSLPDLRNACQALAATLELPEAWELTLALAKALHPKMERQGHWAEWDWFLLQLCEHAQRRADQAAEITLLLRRGAIQRQRGDYSAALRCYYQVWQSCRGTEDLTTQAVALSNLGDLYRLQGYSWRAEILCRRAFQLFEAQGELLLLAQTANHLGLIYLDQKRWAEAIPYFNQAKLLFEQCNDALGLGLIAQNLGVLYQQAGEPALALDCLQQALYYHQLIDNQVVIPRLYLNLGNIYESQQDWSQAESTYAHAETLFQQIGDPLHLARVRHNLGMVYTHLQRWEEAQACFLRALEYWRAHTDLWNCANTLSEFAAFFIAQGAWEQAQVCLDEAWSLVKNQQDPRYRSIKQEISGRYAQVKAGLGNN